MSAAPALRRVTRSALVRRARDATASTAPRSALVVAPHPDDETLGCGATILRKRAAGTAVTLLLVTDGRHSHAGTSIGPEELAARRRLEMAEATARLGLGPEDLRWAGLEDGAVGAAEDTLRDLLAALVVELAPDEVYATCAEEPHPDHAAVGRAARRAVAGLGPGTRPTLLEYPVWLWGGWPLASGGRLRSSADALARTLGRRAVRVSTGEYAGPKLHALAAHASQLTRPGSLRSDEPWEVLPAAVLSAATGPVELFLVPPA